MIQAVFSATFIASAAAFAPLSTGTTRSAVIFSTPEPMMEGEAAVPIPAPVIIKKVALPVKWLPFGGLKVPLGKSYS